LRFLEFMKKLAIYLVIIFAAATAAAASRCCWSCGQYGARRYRESRL